MLKEQSLPTNSQSTPRTSTLYRLVWKWHFLASLFVLPFMAMLSITGGLYLFTDEIEEVIYSNRLNVTTKGAPLPLNEQAAAAAASLPDSRIRSVVPSTTPGRTTVVELQNKNRQRYVAWVNPYNATVIQTQFRDSLLMRQVRNLHGELLLGSYGTKAVELAAHWAIVMFVTGIYLWWPRGNRSWRVAFTLPSGKGRSFWRQTHLFTGLLATILIVPILITGLPWTDVWGGGFKWVQERTGQISPSRAFGGDPILSGEPSGNPLNYDQVLQIAQNSNAPGLWEIRPPKNETASYFVSNVGVHRTERVELHIDQYNGTLLNEVKFSDFPPLAAAVSLGISFHQGELYGWLNVAQNSLAAILGLTLSVSGFIAWWMRRPAGSLGIPVVPSTARTGAGLILVIATLAVFLPLMGASLICVLLLDWLIFRRLGWFRCQTENQPATV